MKPSAEAARAPPVERGGVRADGEGTECRGASAERAHSARSTTRARRRRIIYACAEQRTRQPTSRTPLRRRTHDAACPQRPRVAERRHCRGATRAAQRPLTTQRTRSLHHVRQMAPRRRARRSSAPPGADHMDSGVTPASAPRRRPALLGVVCVDDADDRLSWAAESPEPGEGDRGRCF